MDGFRADTYGEAFADVYDRWYGDISDPEATADFVHRRSAPGAVLELGVGSGRLARPLAARGRAVVGVDTSASMLQRCRLAAPDVVLVKADMAAVPLAGTFGGVLCAFNTLFNVATVERQRATLAEARRLLSPDGVLVIEAATGEDLASGPASSVGVSRLTTSEVVLSATVLDAAQQLLSGQHIEFTAAGVRLRPWQLRWVTPAQLDGLAADAGLLLADRLGDWDQRPFTTDDVRHVSVYRPA